MNGVVSRGTLFLNTPFCHATPATRMPAFLQAFLSHPASEDGTVTEDEFALFGLVAAEVDRWYKG